MATELNVKRFDQYWKKVLYKARHLFIYFLNLGKLLIAIEFSLNMQKIWGLERYEFWNCSCISNSFMILVSFERWQNIIIVIPLMSKTFFITKF